MLKCKYYHWKRSDVKTIVNKKKNSDLFAIQKYTKWFEKSEKLEEKKKVNEKNFHEKKEKKMIMK